MLIKVSLSVNIFEPLTYRFSGTAECVPVGTRVLVPLGRRLSGGWVVGADSAYRGSAKPVIGTMGSGFFPDARLLEFSRQVAETYFVSQGSILDHALPPRSKPLASLRFRDGERLRKLSDIPQDELLERAVRQPLDIVPAADVAQVPAGGKELLAPPLAPAIPPGASPPPPRLLLSLERVDEYQRLIDEQRQQGKCVLLIVPDSLTAAYWQGVWPDSSLYLSDRKVSDREKIWNERQQGTGGIVTGGLAAVCLPLPNLGAIIVDRAGASLYHLAFSGLHVGELARIRARIWSIPLLEGAAALTLDAAAHRTHYLIQDQRPQPPVPVAVRMLKKGEKKIPPDLDELLREAGCSGQKTWIILNRRRSHSVLFCAACQRVSDCPRCGQTLNADDAQTVACPGCDHRQPRAEARCRRCRGELTTVPDLSLDSLQAHIRRYVGAAETAVLTPELLVDAAAAAALARQHRLLLSTAQAINPLFKGIFDHILYLKPESLFSLNRFRSAEMIFATVAELKELLRPGGRITIYSAFHFHYALQLLDQEQAFFDRELKYRHWFLLPPYARVWRLELKQDDLRSLAGRMRDLYRQWKETLHIRRAYLTSRRKIRNSYRGVLELHCQTQELIRSGLPQQPHTILSPLEDQAEPLPKRFSSATL